MFQYNAVVNKKCCNMVCRINTLVNRFHLEYISNDLLRQVTQHINYINNQVILKETATILKHTFLSNLVKMVRKCDYFRQRTEIN